MSEEAKKKKSRGQWFREMKSELKKVVWPNKQTVVKNTGTVLLCSLILGACIWIFDFVAVSAVDLILAGELVKATVAQQPYEMGYQVVEAAVKAVKGESVDEVINAPVQVVTAENGQAYLDNLAAMKG